MKAKLVLGFLGILVIGLMSSGSSCLNDPFIVPLNAPLTHCDTTNPGGTWGPPNDAPTEVRPLDEIPEAYRDAVVGARLVDVVVYAVDPNPNAQVSGEAGFEISPGVYQRVVSFQGTGAQFAQRRSLLTDQAPLIVADPTGIALLENEILQFVDNPEGTVIYVWSSGTVSPAVTGQEVCVEILVQVDAEVSVE